MNMGTMGTNDENRKICFNLISHRCTSGRRDTVAIVTKHGHGMFQVLVGFVLL